MKNKSHHRIAPTESNSELSNDSTTDGVPIDSAQPGTISGRQHHGFLGNNRVLVVLVLFVLALSIRVVAIGEKSLWLDEASSVVIAQADLVTILQPDRVQVHPPGYYVLLKWVLGVGESEAIVRLPSALASAAAVALVFLIVMKLFDRQVALLSAALLLLSPLDLWYAQEARQPAIAIFVVLLGFYFLSLKSWIGYVGAVLSLVIGLYMDFITAAGWLALGAVWTYWWWNRYRPAVRDWVVVTGVAALIYAPIRGGQFMEGFNTLLKYEAPGLWYGRVLSSTPLTSNALGLLALAFGLVLLTSVVVGRLLASPNMGRLWAATAVSGYILITVLTPIPRAFSVKKVVVVGWPIVVLVIAYIILRKLTPSRSRQAIVIVLIVSALGVISTWLVPKDDWRGAVKYINTNATAEDTAWVSSEPWGPHAYLYYEGTLPVLNTADPAGTLPAGGDVWMITKRRPQDPIPAIPAETWFDDNWRLVDEIPFYRLSVRQYAAPPSG